MEVVLYQTVIYGGKLKKKKKSIFVFIKQIIIVYSHTLRQHIASDLEKIIKPIPRCYRCDSETHEGQNSDWVLPVYIHQGQILPDQLHFISCREQRESRGCHLFCSSQDFSPRLMQYFCNQIGGRWAVWMIYKKGGKLVGLSDLKNKGATLSY